MQSIDLKFRCCLLTALVFLFSTPLVQAAVQSESAVVHDTQTNNDRKKFSAEDLLQRFADQGSRQIFDGTFVYFFEDKVQTIKVHRAIDDNGQVIEELLPMDGQQKKNTRILKNQFCALNNNWPYQFQAMSSSFPFRVNNYYKQLQQNYSVSLTGKETVAGMPAIGLTINSKDPYRYGYRLWFEPRTATLLKYKLVDQKGKAVEQYLFTDINIQNKPSPAKRLNSETPIVSCKVRFAGLTAAFNEYFAANKIPAGYEPVSFRKGYIHGSDRQAFQFQLSDGLSTVSIFIEDSKSSSKVINGVVKLGPVNVVGKTMGRHQVTIIGAIPINSALHFLTAVKLSSSGNKKLSHTGIAADD